MGAASIHRRTLLKVAPVPFLTFNDACILLPSVPTARTIALLMRVPNDSQTDRYLLDNRSRDTDNSTGVGYLGTFGADQVSVYVADQLDNPPLPLLRTGTWQRAFIELAVPAGAPTVLGRYSWNAGGVTGLYGNVGVAELIIYNRYLTPTEKANSLFPSDGRLARYRFTLPAAVGAQNGSVKPLPDVSGQGLDAQIGIAQNGSIVPGIL